MGSEFCQLCTSQQGAFKSHISTPSLPLTHGTQPTATHTGRLDITDLAGQPQTQDLMQRGQRGRQHRAVHLALEWRQPVFKFHLPTTYQQCGLAQII